MYVDTYV